MTRKDTIIAAVLVNAGLLVILFSTALKSNTQEPSYMTVAPMAKEVREEVAVKKEVVPSAGDEVDQILKQYGNATGLTVTPPSTDQNAFAKDLESITTVEAPVALATPTVPEIKSPIAVVPEALPASMNKEFIEYKVKKGDVLEKIARHHHCTVDEIMKMNHLNSAYLKIGQTLKVPSKTGTAAFSKTPAKAIGNASSGAKYYTVKNGDNPWTIAVKNHMKLEELLKLNHLDEEKARKLKPGDQLLISQ